MNVTQRAGVVRSGDACIEMREGTQIFVLDGQGAAPDSCQTHGSEKREAGISSGDTKGIEDMVSKRT
jgi:hypothetical protein